MAQVQYVEIRGPSLSLLQKRGRNENLRSVLSELLRQCILLCFCRKFSFDLSPVCKGQEAKHAFRNAMQTGECMVIVKDEGLTMKRRLYVTLTPAANERIWAGDHTDAPAARTGGLFKAEEDHRRQLREGHHQRAQVTSDADIVARTHFLDDVISVRRTVLLVLPWPGRGDAPQRHRTLLARHGDPAEI